MSIRIKFDTNHNPIPPDIILCNRTGKPYGVINNVSGISVSGEMDTVTMSFDVYKYDNDIECELWNKIIDFKLIYVPDWDMYFDITVTFNDSESILKSVECTALGQSELSQIKLFGIEINTEEDIDRDEYEIPTIFYNPEHPEASLVNRLSEKIPHYTIKHVDETIKRIQRVFSFNEKSIEDAFNEIAEEMQIYVMHGNGSVYDEDLGMNVPERSLSFYDMNTNCSECGYRGEFDDVCPECGSTDLISGFGKDTTIFFSRDGLSDDIELHVDTKNVFYCFMMQTGDDLMDAAVRSVNPNGTSYIWKFSEEAMEDMPEELVEKINEYDNIFNEYRNKSYEIDNGIVSEYNVLVEKYKKYYDENEYNVIENPIYGHSDLISHWYDAIDFYLYLQSALMPTVKMQDTNAEREASNLTASILNPIAVNSLKSASHATVDSNVLAMAKVSVDSRYQIKIKSSTYTTGVGVWSGIFTITNYSDEEDTADTTTISLTISEDIETSLKQRLDRILDKSDKEEYGIVGLFHKTCNSTANGEYSGDFVDELKKYSLNCLKGFYECARGCIDVLMDENVTDVNSKGDPVLNVGQTLLSDYRTKMAAIEVEISVRDQECDLIDEIITEIEKIIEQTQSTLNFEEFIGERLWKILCQYRRESTYSNKNFISDGLNNAELIKNAEEFYKRASEEIYKSSTSQYVLSSNIKNLLAIEDFKPLIGSFEIGNWMRIEADDQIYKLRLVSFEIDYDDLDNCSVEFSNVSKISTGYTDISDILERASSIASSYDSVERQAEQGAGALDNINKWFTEGLDATLIKIINNAQDQTVVQDGHGILCRRYDDITDGYYDTQLRIMNSTIALTTDAWQTTKTAIGKFYYEDPSDDFKLKEAYGVNGETIVGRLLLGENLGLYNESGSMTFDKYGLKISNESNVVQIDPNAERIFRLNNGTEDVLYFGSNGVLHIAGDGSGLDISSNDAITGLSSRLTVTEEGLKSTVTADNVVSIIEQSAKEIYLSADHIILNGDTSIGDYITLGTDGKLVVDQLVANNADISGHIEATSGTFNGTIYATDGEFAGELKAATGSFTGAVTATSLTLGSGVTISADDIDGLDLDDYLTNDDLNKKGYVTNEDLNEKGYAYSSQLSNYITYSETGNFIKIATPLMSKNGEEYGYFEVSTDGLLQAKNAVIEGTIHATSGYFIGTVTTQSHTPLTGGYYPYSRMTSDGFTGVGYIYDSKYNNCATFRPEGIWLNAKNCKTLSSAITDDFTGEDGNEIETAEYANVGFIFGDLEEDSGLRKNIGINGNGYAHLNRVYTNDIRNTGGYKGDGTITMHGSVKIHKYGTKSKTVLCGELDGTTLTVYML